MMIERVVFMQDSNATETLDILYQNGQAAALEHLKQWHNPGEHETDTRWGYGAADYTYREGRYLMTYNTGLGYVGLEYRVE